MISLGVGVLYSEYSESEFSSVLLLNICKLQNARCLMDKTSHSTHTKGMHLIIFINDGLGSALSIRKRNWELGVFKMIRMSFSH